MKRVLIVSPHFPPSTVAGVHRARMLARHLPGAGWEPVVFCVHEAFHEQTLDPELATLVPAAMRVIKVPAWPTRLSRAFGIGDLGVRGYGHLKRGVGSFLEKEGADLLFITVLPGFPMLMAPTIKRRYGIPFILDYQDPWRSRTGTAAPFPTKAWAANGLARLVEPRVIRDADHVTTVSEGTSRLIRSLYPDLPESRFSAIPIGGDPGDFEGLDRGGFDCPWLDSSPGAINVVYVGNVWTGAHRTVRAFLQSVRLLSQEAPEVYRRVRLVFLGSSNQPGGERPVVKPMAEQAGLAGRVVELPGRVSYLDALRTLRRADVVMMFGSSDTHYTASKLYPVLLAARPVVGIFHEESSVCEIADRVGGVRLIRFGESRPVEATISDIARALVETIREPASVGRADVRQLEPFLGAAIGRRFGELFEEVVQHHAGKVINAPVHGCRGILR